MEQQKWLKVASTKGPVWVAVDQIVSISVEGQDLGSNAEAKLVEERRIWIRTTTEDNYRYQNPEYAHDERLTYKNEKTATQAVEDLIDRIDGIPI